VEAMLGTALVDSLPKVKKPISFSTLRSKRAAEHQERNSPFEINPGPQPNETVCCPTNISVFFPVSGISATKMERVPVLQIGPLRQPVIYNRCLQKECRILRGYCTQIYLPQFMYILASDNEGNLSVERDFILVESGCECQTDWQSEPHRISPAVEIESDVYSHLHFKLGIDESFQDVPFLATISNAPVSASSSTPSPNSGDDKVQNSTTANPATSEDLTGETTEEASQQPSEQLNEQPTVRPTEQSAEQITEDSQPEQDQSTEKSTEQSTGQPMEETTPDPMHQAVATESTPAEEPTAESQSVNTPPPLLRLPRPGLPVNLLGHYDPVMSAISKFIEL